MAVSDVMKMVKDNNVKFVDFRFTDTKGKEQHVSVPISAFDEDKFKDVSYVKEFFKYLHQLKQDGKIKEIKEIMNSEQSFCEKLNNRIEEMCDTFFGLNIGGEDNDEEW